MDLNDSGFQMVMMCIMSVGAAAAVFILSQLFGGSDETRNTKLEEIKQAISTQDTNLSSIKKELSSIKKELSSISHSIYTVSRLYKQSKKAEAQRTNKKDEKEVEN